MRLIDLSLLKDAFNELPDHDQDSFDSWIEKAETCLDEIRNLPKDERGKYWAKNNIWTELYPALSKISGHKCWYSEAPESGSEWEIDHFRPKGKSMKEDGTIIRSDGYWWLSYNWENFRLAGSLVNRRRQDRFDTCNNVYGKGCYFPLGSEVVSCAEDRLCEEEVPLLLDPTKPRDVTLISFDKNGHPFPTYSKEEKVFLYKKATLSIEYYGLEHIPFCRERRKVWAKCEDSVRRVQNKIVNDLDNVELAIEKCFMELSNYSKITEPYSMVVRNFIKDKLEDDSYIWLKEVESVLL